MGFERWKELDAVFNPRGVAVVGATHTPDKVGYNLVESLLYGGFRGRVYPIHPRHEEILGLKVYRRLGEVEGPLDLVVIALNQFATVEMVEECGRMGVKGVVCIAGGFREMGPEGEELERRLVEATRKHGLVLVGPNTLGLMNVPAGFMATFYPMRPEPGLVSWISQSGGIGLSILRRAADEGLGVAKWVGVGNRGSLEFADYLEYLGADEGTRVIGVVLEGSEEAGRFVRVAREITLRKPVVVYKVARSAAANHAALTHTGTMAGSPRMYADILAQCGIIRVESVAEMVAACKALAVSRLPAGGGVGVLTHTAGPSIVALDGLSARGVKVPALAPETLQGVESVIGENPPVVLKNPVDVAGLGFLAETYGQVAEVVVRDPAVHLLLAIYCQHKNWRFPSRELAGVLQQYGKPVVACYLSTLEGVGRDRQFLEARGVPVFTTAEEAAWGAAALVAYAEAGVHGEGRSSNDRPTMAELGRVAGSRFPAARDLLQRARGEGRNVLLEAEAKELLAAAGIKTTRLRIARTEEEAVAAAEGIGYPVALKVMSREAVHKSERGGVRLNLGSEGEVREAYKEIMKLQASPGGRGGKHPSDDGLEVTVQEMVSGGTEVIVGATRDPHFGPVLMFGLGGIWTEVMEDVAFRLCPLTLEEARGMIESIKGYPLLAGYRGRPAGNLEELVGMLARISQLVVDYPDLLELDLNPVTVLPDRAVVLDARARITG